MEISTVSEFETVRSNEENSGKTFTVSQNVFSHYAAKFKVTPASSAEISQINEMLGTNLVPDKGTGITRESKCTECGHVLSFADHVKVALSMKAHAKEELVRILSSGVHYLTVDSDKQREIQCPMCKKSTVVIHCCYTGHSYAYA